MQYAIGTRKDPNISKGIIERKLIPLPSIEEQKEISELLMSCDLKITALESELALLNELLNAMIDALTAGLLSVSTLINESAS